MNCFYHPTIVAIGICKSCNKGVCPACAIDTGKGVACKGQCEEAVKAVTALIERNVRLSPVNEQLIHNARSNRYLGPIFYLTFGIFCLAFAAYQHMENGSHPGDFLVGGMGFLFFLFGLVTLRRTIRYNTIARQIR